MPQKGVDTSFVSDVFIEHNSKKRDDLEGLSNSTDKKRRKKLTAPPGKSIGCGDLLMEEEMSSPSTSAGAKFMAKKRKRVLESDSGDDSDHVSLHEYSDTFNVSESDDAELETTNDLPLLSLSEKKKFKEDDFIIVTYDKKHFARLISKLPDKGEAGPTVDCMERRSKCWIWPEKKDKLVYSWSDQPSKTDEQKRTFFNSRIECFYLIWYLYDIFPLFICSMLILCTFCFHFNFKF